MDQRLRKNGEQITYKEKEQKMVCSLEKEGYQTRFLETLFGDGRGETSENVESDAARMSWMAKEPKS